MTSPIIDFIEARLKDDENAARFAIAEHNHAEPEWSEIRSGAIQLGPHEDELITFDAGISRHIVRHDPARVLREVAAKRALVEHHGDQHECTNWELASAYPYVGCSVLRALAAVYSDHPDYRKEWTA